jgi:hypothetical protein
MAKEQKPETSLPPDPDASEALGPPKSYRLYIAIGLVSLVLFQTFILAIALRAWFPLPKEANMGLDIINNSSKGLDEVDTVPPDIGQSEALLEKPVNEGKAIKVQQLRGDQIETFSLVMHVRIRKKDERKFDDQYEKCKNTINDRITSMLKATSPEDRTELNSTAIKAKAKKVINDVLGVTYVQEVLVTEVVPGMI